MSEERFKEIFRRITAETPDAPAFSDLEIHRAKPAAPIRLKPWMAAVGAAALVLVVVGAFGLLGGGGPDLAAPDENTIDYLKLEYSGSAQADCTGGEVIDNFGHLEATIEIWGPNSDALTLMVTTFPDGSTERTVIEGVVGSPVRGWGRDPTAYPDDTFLRVIGCETSDSEVLPLLEGFNLPDRGTIPPSWFLSPPGGSGTWSDVFGDAIPAELDGTPVLLYELRRDNDDAVLEMDLYVTEDNDTLLRNYTRATYHGVGSVVVDVKVVEKTQVSADSVSFDTSGLVAIDYSRGFELGREHCPVTIPSQTFTPPDSHPPTPSGSNMVWFGKDELWTVLSTDGISEERKSVWWSAEFTDPGIESSPEITVTYTLLNSATALTIVNDQGTNASTAEDGLFIIAGSEPDIEGCWQVTAIYKNASLSYIYYNPEGLEASLGTVPDVVGMTVNEARSVLETLGYRVAFHDSANPTYQVCAQEPGAGSEIDPGEVIGMRTATSGECGELTGGTLELNPDYDIYTDEMDRTWYSTACTNADVLVAAGVEWENGLPEIGQTSPQLVELVVANNADYFLDQPGVVDVRAVPRNGEVWEYDSDGHVIVTLVHDFMIEAVINNTFRCPGIPAFYDGIPIAFAREEISCHDEVTAPEEAITVFFNCGDGPDPNPTALHYEEFGEIRDLLTATFGHLVVGPSFVESEQGFNSLFGFETATSVENVELVGSRLTVHFNESIATNNASTATGSAFFLAELYATAFQFEDVESVEFRINGSCEAFWEFLQAGPECNITDRAAWEQIQSQWENG